MSMPSGMKRKMNDDNSEFEDPCNARGTLSTVVFHQCLPAEGKPWWNLRRQNIEMFWSKVQKCDYVMIQVDLMNYI